MVAASTWALTIAIAIAVAVAILASKLLAEGQGALLMTYAVHAVAALILLGLLAFVGLYLLFSETRSALLVGNGTRIATPVAIGVVSDAARFDTQNELMPNHVAIARSFNRLGGAELSYAFWVYKRNNIETLETLETEAPDPGLDVQDVILLLKGDLKTALTAGHGTDASTKYDVLVKAPLVKFDRSTDRLTVEFNTSDPSRVNGVLEGAGVGGAAALPARAAHATQVSVYGLNDPKFNARWFHVAVVLKDNDPESRRDRNIQARIFVNGEAVFDRNVVGTIDAATGGGATLRQNDGFLYLLPKASWTDANGSHTTLDTNHAWVTTKPTGPLLKDASGNITQDSTASASQLVDVNLADVWHYNYALDDGEVKKLYARGVTKQAAAIGSPVPSTGEDNAYRMSEPTAWKRVQAV